MGEKICEDVNEGVLRLVGWVFIAGEQKCSLVMNKFIKSFNHII